MRSGSPSGVQPPSGQPGVSAIAALENVGLAPAGAPSDEQPLFQPVDPYATGMLDVGAPHRIYWEQSGNPVGVPIVFFHGGPGAGTAPAYRRFFDPAHYRIVLFDQRGAGHSAPEAELTDNTTQHLIADVERLRAHLRIPKWIVFGGSWGSTLALAYGQAHPERCIGFILRGVFLFSDDEVRWFLGNHTDGGMARFFPEAHRAFANFIPADERDDLLGAYYKRLTNPEPTVHRPAAAVWCAYENACSRLIPSSGRPVRGDTYYNGALAMARIEAHYMMHHGFLAPGQLLQNVGLLADHPAVIIQGRYDMVCPISAADALARVWHGAQFRIIADAGHSSMEPGIRTALVRATEEFKTYA